MQIDVRGQVARETMITDLAISWTFVALLALVLLWLAASPSRAEAQQPLPSTAEGESAIYKAIDTPVNSLATVDASIFYPAQGDICGVISYILTNSSEFSCGPGNPRGVVIDARGIRGLTPGTPLQCSGNPFVGNNCKVDGEQLASTILLPAATIQIQATWILPSNARILGEGQNLTILQACTTALGCPSNFSGDMIQTGSPNNNICNSTLDCQGIGIEHLTLDAQSRPGVNAIHNSIAQELSYVNDVGMSNVAGTGLLVDQLGGNSGPYSNISFSGTGTCVQLLVGTRGIHGLSCTATGSPQSAFLLDGPNSSIEDVYMKGAYRNGILIGANGPAQGNVLFNINGVGLTNDVVAISNQTSGTPAVPNASDISILGVAASGGGAGTIGDSLNNTFLGAGHLGMYVLGESVTGAGNVVVGYSRFTTSPSIPAWFIGSGPPSSSCATGSLYSDKMGPSTATLWTCVSPTTGSPTGSWAKVK
jgi:hypothetical protein